MGSKDRRAKSRPSGNSAFGLFVRRMGSMESVIGHKRHEHLFDPWAVLVERQLGDGCLGVFPGRFRAEGRFNHLFEQCIRKGAAILLPDVDEGEPGLWVLGNPWLVQDMWRPRGGGYEFVLGGLGLSTCWLWYGP